MCLHRIITLVPLALVLALPDVSFAQAWEKYYGERDQFIVNFPGEPRIEEIEYISETGVPIPARVYSVESRGSRFAITVVDYTVAEQAHIDFCRAKEAAGERISPNQCTGRGHLRDIDGSIAYEAFNIRRRYADSEITYDAFGRVDGVAGHQLQFLHPDGSRSFIGLYLEGRRLYVLDGTVPGDAPPPGLFQQSLGMLDEMGRRIRYQGDSEGRYARVQTLYEYLGDEDPVTGEPISDAFGGAADGEILAPNARTGQWVPEETRGDLALLAGLIDDAELFARIDESNVSAADLARFREVLRDFFRMTEFAWLQFDAGVLDEATFRSYLEEADDLLSLQRTRTEWRAGVFSGNAKFMAYMDGWFNVAAGVF